MSEDSQRILIIEDNPEFGAYLKMLVDSEKSCRAALVPNGLDGLNACLKQPPDLVVLDLNLPGLRGEEILRLLRSSPYHRHVPVLICSEMPREQRREFELLQLGASGYVEKPFDEREFLEDLHRLLGTAQQHRHVAAMPPGQDSRRDTTSTPSFMKFGRRSEDKLAAAPAIHDKVFEGYRILEMLGGGSAGTVYKARHEGLGRVVALKILLRRQEEEEDSVARFHREARIMAQLNHPNVIQIYDIGSTGFTLYFSMEYVEGGSLQDYVARCNLEPKQMRMWVEQTFDAVAYLHGEGVIHRDIKPGNILLSRSGRVKVCDFGISRARLPSDRQEFTKIQFLMGTPLYMAPELVTGTVADEISDQYAIGRTFYRLFEGGTVHLPPPPLERLRPDLPMSVCAALGKMIHVDRNQRFPSLGEARESLLAGLEEWSQADPETER